MTTSLQVLTTRRALAACAIALSLGLAGCATGPRLVTPEPPPIPEAGPAVPAANTAILEAGQQVVARTAAGPMKIEAGPGLRRVFSWDGLRRGAIVNARSEGFANAQTPGLTFDGTPKVWEAANGVTKLRYEEGVRNYDNIDDATIWMQIRRLYFVYNNDGLVLGWRRDGDALHVELWQFLIDGEKPTRMPDSNSDRITRGPLVVEPQKMYPHLVFDDGHTEEYDAAAREKYNPASGARASSCNGFQQTLNNWFGWFKQCETPDETDTAEDTADTAPAPAPVESTPAPEPEPEPQDERARIKGNVVNIRSGASTNNDVKFQARQGDSVEILKTQDDWSNVKFNDGRTGWVANFLLTQ
ncbi:MAG: hypothetical protein CMP08_02260 [Xanthomonadales bacterium]|nr:hypothetical protein [Xanthomonadales bacterium]